MNKNIEYKGLSTLEVLEWAKNYNNWIADKIKQYITSPALEVGAGTGNITNLVKNHHSITVSDVDKSLVSHLKKRFIKEKNLTFTTFDITKPPVKSVQSKYLSVYAINVLEHIKDDTQALRNIKTILRVGGKVILLVPAKQFAYSELDRQLGHYRRYERQELVRKLEKAGFKLERIEYFNIVGLLSWITRNKVERNHYQLRSYQIKLFEYLVPILRRIEAVVPVPIGISLIVVAKKVK